MHPRNAMNAKDFYKLNYLYIKLKLKAANKIVLKGKHTNMFKTPSIVYVVVSIKTINVVYYDHVLINKNYLSATYRKKITLQ